MVSISLTTILKGGFHLGISSIRAQSFPEMNSIVLVSVREMFEFSASRINELFAKNISTRAFASVEILSPVSIGVLGKRRDSPPFFFFNRTPPSSTEIKATDLLDGIAQVSFVSDGGMS